MYRHFGSTGIPMAQVENASASGSTAVRQACIDVAAGLADVAIAVGVDKPLKFGMPQPAAGFRDLVGGRVAPFTHFALLANRYIHEHGATEEQFALVAVKNSENGALNPNAQRQKARSLEEVLAPPLISGPLTRLQCCPVGEGAAAVIVASDARNHAPRARSSARGPSPVVGLPIGDRVPGRELRRRADRARRSASPFTTRASRRTTSTSSSFTTRSRSRSCSTSKRSGWLPSARLRHISRRASSMSADASP